MSSSSPPGSGGSQGWIIGAAVGAFAGACAVAATAMFAVAARRRKRRRSREQHQQLEGVQLERLQQQQRQRIQELAEQGDVVALMVLEDEAEEQVRLGQGAAQVCLSVACYEALPVSKFCPLLPCGDLAWSRASVHVARWLRT